MALKAGDIAIMVPGQGGLYTVMPYVRPKAGDAACLAVGQDHKSAPFAVVNPKAGDAALVAAGQDAKLAPVATLGEAVPCTYAASNGDTTPRGVRITLTHESGASRSFALYQSSNAPCAYTPRGMAHQSHYGWVPFASYDMFYLSNYYLSDGVWTREWIKRKTLTKTMNEFWSNFLPVDYVQSPTLAYFYGAGDRGNAVTEISFGQPTYAGLEFTSNNASGIPTEYYAVPAVVITDSYLYIYWEYTYRVSYLRSVWSTGEYSSSTTDGIKAPVEVYAGLEYDPSQDEGINFGNKTPYATLSIDGYYADLSYQTNGTNATADSPTWNWIRRVYTPNHDGYKITGVLPNDPWSNLPGSDFPRSITTIEINEWF